MVARKGDLGADMVAIAKAIIEQRTGEFDRSTYRDLTRGGPRLPQQLACGGTVQAEAALAAYVDAWGELPGDESANV
jgi:hypothetical protein